MNQMMNPNVDITLVIRKSADGRMGVSVLPKFNTLKDEAQNSIVPLTLNGTPEELDTGFMQVVARPMQKASGLISNMAQFEGRPTKRRHRARVPKKPRRKSPKRTGRRVRSMRRISRKQRSISPPRDIRRPWTRLPRHASTPNPTT